MVTRKSFRDNLLMLLSSTDETQVELAHAVDKTWKTKGTARRHLSWVCDINRHQIRHDYATSLFRAGLPVKTVQHLLGHSDYSTTMNIYVHFQRENVDDARAQIEQYIKENKKSAGQ